MKPQILFTFVITLLFSTAAFSQDIAQTLKNRTPEEKATGLTMIMKTKLNLDTAQTTKVKVINLKYAQKTEEVTKADDGKFAKFKKLRDIQKDKDADLKGILNADQFKQYQALEDEIKEKMKEKMKERKQS
jgi:DNA primase large subunit